MSLFRSVLNLTVRLTYSIGNSSKHYEVATRKDSNCVWIPYLIFTFIKHLLMQTFGAYQVVAGDTCSKTENR